MLRKVAASRGFLSFGLIVVLCVLAAVAFKVAKPTPKMQSYCAQMPDAIGLFVGSDVTIMGVPVGRITKVTPDGPKAKVEFDVPAERSLPPDVGATTLSDSLIADRKLAVIGDEPTNGPKWNPSDCITKTVTPRVSARPSPRQPISPNNSAVSPIRHARTRSKAASAR